jgi:hypothetical protein
MKLIIYGLLIYLLYKIIFDVVIPVSNGVKTVRHNMEQMQRQQAEAIRQAQKSAGQSNGPNSRQANTAASTPKKEVPTSAEYIDFEEVKK